MRSHRPVLLAAALLLSLPAILARAAEPSDVRTQQSRPTDAATIQVFSRETIVDVTVTDDNGRPVLGLKQSDFTVQENGNPQPIRSFREFGPPLAPRSRYLPRLPEGIYTNDQTSPATGPVNLLLLDALNSKFSEIGNAKDGVLKYLDKMPPGTQVAVFWLSQSGLHLLHGFTNDPGILRHVIGIPRIDIGSNLAKQDRDRYTVDALQQLAQYVAGIKGRKNLLWFAPGMPINVMRDGGYGWQLTDSGAVKPSGPDMWVVHKLMDTYELLTAEQIAVYPIDTYGAFTGPHGEHPMNGAPLRAEQVAEDTGGLALYNSNDIASLVQQAVDHGSHFYTLSYTPPNSVEDGHYHHINIAVDRPGLHLVYRKGYNAEDPPAPQLAPGGPVMKAAMEGSAAPVTQLVFDAQITLDAYPAPASGIAEQTSASPTPPAKTTHFNILYLVPQSEIAFATNPDGTHTGSLEFDTVVYDSNRKRVALATQTLQLPLTAEEYRDFIRTPFKFSQAVDLPDGNFTVRVGILDGVSNKVGTLEMPFTLEIPRMVPSMKQRAAAVPAVAPPPCPPRCPMATPDPPH